jgi:hypothetical protein
MSKKKNREKKKNLKISSNMHKRKQIQESPDLQTGKGKKHSNPPITKK